MRWASQLLPRSVHIISAMMSRISGAIPLIPYVIFADGSTHISPRTGLPITNYHISVGTASLGAVPEPAFWAMMLVGFGLAGTAMRCRRASVSFA